MITSWSDYKALRETALSLKDQAVTAMEAALALTIAEIEGL